jgi:hypothetical protein
VRNRLVALLIVVVVAVASVAGCGESSSYALRVNGRNVSMASFDAELAGLAGNTTLSTLFSLAPQGETPLSYTQDFVGGAAALRAQSILVENEFRKRKLTLTSEVRGAVDQAFFDNQPVIAGFTDKAYGRDFRDNFARRLVLSEKLGGPDAFALWLDAATNRAHVTINPRFGTWNPDPNRYVVPPAGPATPVGSG